MTDLERVIRERNEAIAEAVILRRERDALIQENQNHQGRINILENVLRDMNARIDRLERGRE